MQERSGSSTGVVRRREKAFGKALQAERLKKGISQEELGFEAGYHRTYVSFLERGLKNPTLSTIMDIAATLGLQASDLVIETEKILKDAE